jgi:hypothetical protein
VIEDYLCVLFIGILSLFGIRLLAVLATGYGAPLHTLLFEFLSLFGIRLLACFET